MKRVATRISRQKITKHYIDFFEGHNFENLSWLIGPIKNVLPFFEVIRFSPGPKMDLWVYCSVAASEIELNDSGRHEFVLVSPVEAPRLVEILAMVAYYHSNHNLGFGHTLPIGEPWLEGSTCENLLVSLPYPFGKEFEIMPLGDTHAHVAWLLPITNAERDFKAKHGLEALEQRFDDAGLKYWEIQRASVG